MTAADSVKSPIPAHVPPHLVVDFDVYRPLRPGLGYFESFRAAQAEGLPDLFWSPYNGGSWVAQRRALQTEIFADHTHFTSERGLVAPVVDTGRPKLVPIEADPPRQTKYRALFASAFSAVAIRKLEESARALAIELTEGLKPRGGCEFVTEFAQHLPIKIFMEMVDIPEEDRLRLLPLANAQVEADAPKDEKLAELFHYVAAKVMERQANPGDDLITRVIQSEIDGAPIALPDAISVVSLLLIGGLDTVASMLGHIMNYLAHHPEQRRALIDNPALIPGAVEEFLRRFALTNPGRVVKDDMDFHGVAMKANELVILSTPFGALDPEYDDAFSIDMTRRSATKSTFGAGAHVCPGSMLARLEVKILLEEWLPRIPDFTLDPEHEPRIRTGVNGSFERLPLVWSIA